jgi:16S rRNA (adenine1518-N6/adenine1519-N6)-dimethyltransferase
MTIPPLKKFGQNFLTDKNLINKIIEVFNINQNDHIVEIGPGLGALTQKIAQHQCKYVAFDIDERMVTHLQNLNLNAKLKDFLAWDFSDFSDFSSNKLRLIGNLPYNITSPIIFHVVKHINLVQDCMFMMQLEVAKRINAKPNCKEYGRLSVMCQYYFDTKLVLQVPPKVFIPVPKVDSAVLYLQPKKELPDIDTNLFAQVVKQAFSSRRKTIKNNLSNYEYALKKANISLSLRPENLSANDYVNITRSI